MQTGRIIKLLGGFYTVASSEGRIYETRARGNFRDQGKKPLVGDFVDFENNYILKIHERENFLVRPAIANLDQVVVVMSTVEPKFSYNLLDRFLVLLEHHHLPVLIYLSKTDLEELDLAIYEQIGYPVLSDFQTLLEYLKNKTTILMGQTGVGKSSLLNRILPSLELETGEISDKLGRGRHTTRHVELYQAAEGLIADTPGFSSLNYEVDNGPELNRCFIEIYNKSADCKFRECSHTHEPDCAVKKAVERGEIAQSRYDNYLQILSEINKKRETYVKKAKKQYLSHYSTQSRCLYLIAPLGIDDCFQGKTWELDDSSGCGSCNYHYRRLVLAE